MYLTHVKQYHWSPTDGSGCIRFMSLNPTSQINLPCNFGWPFVTAGHVTNLSAAVASCVLLRINARQKHPFGRVPAVRLCARNARNLIWISKEYFHRLPTIYDERTTDEKKKQSYVSKLKWIIICAQKLRIYIFITANTIFCTFFGTCPCSLCCSFSDNTNKIFSCKSLINLRQQPVIAIKEFSTLNVREAAF